MSGALPQGACDCHCHVFGPVARFPYAEPRSYTPGDASGRSTPDHRQPILVDNPSRLYDFLAAKQ
jgi:predicted TIM-barrel fold metal-dependent hydrolase